MTTLKCSNEITVIQKNTTSAITEIFNIPVSDYISVCILITLWINKIVCLLIIPSATGPVLTISMLLIFSWSQTTVPIG